MQDELFDIAIIGGGLAGLTLAIQCADAGRKTALFEKENYPFHKVCGEYISRESYGFLERCGLPLNDWALPDIGSLQLSDSSGREFDFNLPLGGFGVSRYKLDQALYHTALRKGVTIFAGTKVNDVFFQHDRFLVRAGSRVTAAKVAAGCFGKRSNLDVKWNRRFASQRPGKLGNFIGVKYHVNYPQPPGTIALHNFRDGYCGISRIEDGKSCLCYLTTAANLKQAGNSVTEMERTILGANPRLRKIFAEARFLYDEPLVISQVSFHPKEQVEQHVLMLGDAAGMISPLCGNGMSMAMHAGKLAFTEIDKFLAGAQTREAMEKNYTTAWKKQFARRLQTGRAVQYFFGGNLSTSLFLRSMHAIRPLSRAIISQTHGAPF